MTKHRKKQKRPETLPTYTLLVQPLAYQEIKQLPGYVRHRVRRAIDELATAPRPSGSRQLEQEVTTREARRLRLNKWRILYALDETWKEIAVIAIRQRPPYQYADLEELLKELDD
jgi:mRNA interferase RelE/StbE